VTQIVLSEALLVDSLGGSGKGLSMYGDVMPWTLDGVVQGNMLMAAIKRDERLDFHPDDPDSGCDLRNRISKAAEYLRVIGIRPQIINKLKYKPSLWKSLDDRQMLISILAAQDVARECSKFVLLSHFDFLDFYSQWAPKENKKRLNIDYFPRHLSKLGVSVETDGAGIGWIQYRPTVIDLIALAIFGSVKGSPYVSDEEFLEGILKKRDFKSYYFSNEFFHLLGAYLSRGVNNEWFFFRLQECWQILYFCRLINNHELLETERERLASVSPLRTYTYPEGVEAHPKKMGRT